MRRDAELSIIELCRSGLDPESFRAKLLPRLRRAVPSDGLWWATVDPATLLFTGTYQEEIPERTKPYFLENEFVADDVNKWVDVARHPGGVRTLEDATGGEWSRSARYSEIFQPLGFGDELRAVFSVQGACWVSSASTAKAGTRSRRRTPSSSNESHRTWRSGSAPDLSWGRSTPRMWPGRQALSSSAPNCRWSAGRRLRSNGSTNSVGRDQDALLPTELLAVAVRVGGAANPGSAVPRIPVKTRTGRWAVLHASRLPTDGGNAIAVIIESASAAEVAQIIMLAYGLSEQERTVTALVCRGCRPPTSRRVRGHRQHGAGPSQVGLQQGWGSQPARTGRSGVPRSLRARRTGRSARRCIRVLRLT